MSTQTSISCISLPDLNGNFSSPLEWAFYSGIELQDSFASILGVPRAFFDENFRLSWKLLVSENGSTDKPRDAGVSTSCLYVTYAEPTISTIYHSVIHISTVEADKVRTGNESDVFNSIWKKFQSLNIKKINIAGGKIVHDDILTYYGKVASTTSTPGVLKVLRFVDGETTPSQLPSIAREESNNNYTNGLTFSLLQSTDGKCGVWQYFFYDIVSVQGINNIEKAGIILKDPTQNFKVYSTAKGQGNLNPKESVWPDHAVVVYNGYVYDPSYGLEYGAKATAIQSFITQSIESFGTIRKFSPTEDTHGGYGGLYTPLSGSIDVGLFKWI